MGILDVFKRSPEKATKTIKRTYAGVDNGRLFADFVASERSADSELRYALKELRNRSRDLSMKVNVIGENGVFHQSKAVDSIGQLDQTGNQAAENAFKMWGRYGSPTVCGKLSWIDVQKLAM